MDLIYRILGVAARFGQASSRFRINFLPFNWIVMGLLAAGLVWAFSMLPDALNNGLHPRAAAIGDVLGDLGNPKTYVTVTGLLDPGAGFTEQSTSNGQPDGDTTYYSILVDPKSNHGILVKTGTAYPGRVAATATVTGLIEQADGELKTKLAGDGSKFGSVTIDSGHVLATADVPGNPAWLFTATGLLAAALAAMAITFLNRYIVFRPTTPAMAQDTLSVRYQARDDHGAADGPEFPNGLRLTGPMVLPGSGVQRFLDMAAAPAYLETGELAFVSRIDASSKFMGVTTNKRAGVWALALKDGRIWNIREGFLYCGVARRPALRFNFNDISAKKPDTAILSFTAPSDRDVMLRTLSLYGKHEIPSTQATTLPTAPPDALSAP
jgi:hypothetical protein